jgi:hypothetical protein
MPNYWSSKGLVVMEKPSGVGVPAEGSLLSAQRCGSPSLAPCCSPQGRKRPWTPVPDSEAMELELFRPHHGSLTDDEGHNAQPPSADVSLLAQLEAWLCIPLETPLISKPRLRRSRTPATVRTVRRSGRLAAKTKASNPTVQAQNVLKQKAWDR